MHELSMARYHAASVKFQQERPSSLIIIIIIYQDIQECFY